VSFAAITLCIASQRVFIVVISLSTQSGNFWIHRCMRPNSVPSPCRESNPICPARSLVTILTELSYKTEYIMTFMYYGNCSAISFIIMDFYLQ
jgi:hypothetical protein